MNFKQFINEEIALGNISGQMEKLFGTKGFDSHAGSYVSSDVSGSEANAQDLPPGYPLRTPGTDIQIPSVERQGRITTLLQKRNPIFIRLSDGTEAFFTFDEFKRIKGKPGIGKTMMISFQMNPEDKTRNHARINKAEVMD